MSSFQISRNAPLRFPKCCAVCGNADVSYVSTYKSNPAGAVPYIVFTKVRWDVQKFEYPVCNRHRALVGLIHFAAPGSLVWRWVGAFGAVFLAAALWGKVSYTLGASLAGVWLLARVARYFVPIFLKSFDDTSLTLVIRSLGYARVFEVANSDAILKKDGYVFKQENVDTHRRHLHVQEEARLRASRAYKFGRAVSGMFRRH